MEYTLRLTEEQMDVLLDAIYRAKHAATNDAEELRKYVEADSKAVTAVSRNETEAKAYESIAKVVIHQKVNQKLALKGR